MAVEADKLLCPDPKKGRLGLYSKSLSNLPLVGILSNLSLLSVQIFTDFHGSGLWQKIKEGQSYKRVMGKNEAKSSESKIPTPTFPTMVLTTDLSWSAQTWCLYDSRNAQHIRLTRLLQVSYCKNNWNEWICLISQVPSVRTNTFPWVRQVGILGKCGFTISTSTVTKFYFLL